MYGFRKPRAPLSYQVSILHCCVLWLYFYEFPLEGWIRLLALTWYHKIQGVYQEKLTLSHDLLLCHRVTVNWREYYLHLQGLAVLTCVHQLACTVDRISLLTMLLTAHNSHL